MSGATGDHSNEGCGGQIRLCLSHLGQGRPDALPPPHATLARLMVLPDRGGGHVVHLPGSQHSPLNAEGLRSQDIGDFQAASRAPFPASGCGEFLALVGGVGAGGGGRIRHCLPGVHSGFLEERKPWPLKTFPSPCHRDVSRDPVWDWTGQAWPSSWRWLQGAGQVAPPQPCGPGSCLSHWDPTSSSAWQGHALGQRGPW